MPEEANGAEVEQIKFKQFNPALSISKIDIADENVRKTQVKTGLNDLKASIEKFGLIHPVIVIPAGDRYNLIVGQRRLLAFKELGRDAIPALIIAPMDSTSQKVVSFGENIHRRKLPYDDTIKICDALFKQYRGNSLNKVRRIAQELGISPATVSKYLAYRLMPDEVHAIVEAGMLPAQVAYRITSAYWPNMKEVVEMVKLATQMTKPEWERVIELKKKKPEASPEEIAALARKPLPEIDIVVTMEAETVHMLEGAAKKRNTDVSGLIKSVIEEWIQEGEA